MVRSVFTAGVLCFCVAQAAAETEFSIVDQDVFKAPNANTSAWADYDRDGDLDVAVAFDTGRVGLYENVDGVFTDIGETLGLPQQGAPARGLSWGDYDDDGDVDLYVSFVSWLSHESNRLFRNDREEGLFADVTEEAGLDFDPVFSRQANWIDFDGDGDLDLYAAQRQGNNRLFKNEGGKFKDVSAAVGLLDPRRTVGACWFDMDQDGDLDLFNANQQADRDALYRNDGGVFTDVALELNMAHAERTIHEGGVACSVTDFDNDGNLDLFVGTYGPDLLYKGDGAGGFVNVAEDIGIQGDTHTVGSGWGDFDHDGNVDLYVTAYKRGEAHGSDRLLRNAKAGFVDVLPESIQKKDSDHGIVWVDYDDDGDLDLHLTSNGITVADPGYASNKDFGNNLVFRNEAGQMLGNSIKISVLNKYGNHTAYGAEVRVYDSDSRELLGTRIVEAGGGYNAQHAMPLHFGLADKTKVDIEVTFIEAGRRTLKKQTGVSPQDFSKEALVIKSD